jgi:hypothetical protein
MLRTFVFSWLIYWGMVLILPVHPIYPAVLQALGLQLSFVVLVCLAYGAMRAALLEPAVPDPLRGEIVGARRIVRWSLVLSLIGLLFLVYDKVVIQGVDYSDGLAVAREQWREIGEEREGRASSVWSALGYLVGSAYYVTTVLLIAQPHRFSSRERLGIAAAAFAFALANSVITGGRSNFMLLAVVAIAAFSARRGLAMQRIFPDRRQRRAILATVALAGVYMVYVFYSRAQASGELVSLYVVNFLPYMGLDFDTWYADAMGQEWTATIGNMSILVIGYLTHSLATFAAIVEAPTEDKVMVFGNVAGILYKLGVIPKPADDWFLAGRFPSVPGALWHQFGAVGFAIGSIVLGAAAATAQVWTARSPRRLFPLGIYVLAGATLILTPYVFAPDFLSGPFVFSAFVILALVGRLATGRRPARSRATGATAWRVRPASR